MNGGGILVSGGLLRVGAGTVVRDNRADANGGNIAVGNDWSTYPSIVGISGASVTGGSAPTGGGAALLEGKLFVLDGSIEDNAAGYGAGVAVLDGEATISGGHIANNIASLKGGGVAVLGGRLAFWSGIIEDNRTEAGDDEWGETTTAEGGGILVGAEGALELSS